jgi:hypothetical protein
MASRARRREIFCAGEGRAARLADAATPTKKNAGRFQISFRNFFSFELRLIDHPD